MFCRLTATPLTLVRPRCCAMAARARKTVVGGERNPAKPKPRYRSVPGLWLVVDKHPKVGRQLVGFSGLHLAALRRRSRFSPMPTPAASNSEIPPSMGAEAGAGERQVAREHDLVEGIHKLGGYPFGGGQGRQHQGKFLPGRQRGQRGLPGGLHQPVVFQQVLPRAVRPRPFGTRDEPDVGSGVYFVKSSTTCRNMGEGTSVLWPVGVSRPDCGSTR